MSNTVKQLGFIPQNRGEFDTTGQTRYYKDNVVQYRNGSYICTPVGYSSSNPTAYTTDAPYQDGDTELNANWKLMASVGLVDDEPTANSNNLVKSGGVYGKISQLGQDVQIEINSSIKKDIFALVPLIKNLQNDLYFADSNGNVLVEFSNGHIKTKNFDSEEIPTDFINTFPFDENNLYFADSNGNVIFAIINGQIISKYFYHQLYQKRISVIGDSISTFAYSVSGDYSGCLNPNVNYIQTSGTDVHTPDDTWFGQLIKKSNAINNRIASYGGGDVVNKLKDYYNRIYSNGTTGTSPDIIFIFAGINDWGHNNLLGSIDDFINDITTSFKGAYCYLLDKLQETFPFAKVIAMTPIYSAYLGTGIPFNTKNRVGLTIRDYANAIIECCENLGVKYIDTNLNCEINRHNYLNLMFDYTHPNKQGLGMIADVVYNNLK